MRLSKEAKKVVHPKDFPTVPHWQIWCQDSYVPVTGWEKEPGGGEGSKTFRWDTYVYLDQALWQKAVLDLTKSNLDAREKYLRTEFVAFAAGARVEAKVTIDVSIPTPPA